MATHQFDWHGAEQKNINLSKYYTVFIFMTQIEELQMITTAIDSDIYFGSGVL